MSFEYLYKVYWDKVFRLCMGYFNDYSLAQDLAQDVFVRVWQYLPTFKGEASVGTWIFRIATNICLRQRERQNSISQAEVPLNLFANESSNNSLQVKALYKAIAELPEMDRLVISLSRRVETSGNSSNHRPVGSKCTCKDTPDKIHISKKNT